MFKEYDSDYGRPKKRSGGKSKSKASTSKSKKKKKKRARVNYDSHLEDESEEDEVRYIYNFLNFYEPNIVTLLVLFEKITKCHLSFRLARTSRSR